ncbi:unnamed protein product, partial [Meganyctiphanes norvegica]
YVIMDWSSSTILLLVCITLSRKYAHACDDECRAAIRSILKEELNPIKEQWKPMDQIKNGILNLKERLEPIKEKFKQIDQIQEDLKLVDRRVGDTLDEVGNVFDMSEEIIRYAKSLEAKQDLMLSELQSVKAQLESQQASFVELKSLSLNTSRSIQQTTDSLNNTILQLSQNAIDVKYHIHDLKTLVNESNVLLDGIKNYNSLDTEAPTTSAKLEAVDESMECQQAEGFFSMSIQCFKIYTDQTRNWQDAKSHCENRGLTLAEPFSSIAVALRKYLLDTYGEGDVWVGAIADGSKFVWQHDRTELRSDSPLWRRGTPHRFTSDRCVEMEVSTGDLTYSPKGPYEDQSCTDQQFVLCEEYQQAEGFFSMPTPFFKIYTDQTRNWQDAKSHCENRGLTLAEPSSSIAVALRKYLLDTYGEGDVWVGAIADGSKFVWQHDRTELRSDSPLWRRGTPHRFTSDRCVEMEVSTGDLTYSPKGPYEDQSCTDQQFVLCEEIRG